MKASLPLVLILANAAIGQEHQAPKDIAGLEKLAGLKWRIDEKGRTWISPDPRGSREGPLFKHTWGEDDAMPEMFFSEPMSNGGMGMWFAYVNPGAIDIASLAHGDAFLRRAGYRLDENALLGVLWGQDGRDISVTGDRWELDRVLAARVAVRRGYRAAVPALQAMAKDPKVKPTTRRAAAECAAKLLGEAPPEWGTPLRPWPAIVRGLPSETQGLAVYHGDASPDLSELGELSRKAGLQTTLQVIQQSGGTVSAMQAAGAVMLSETPLTFPYEFARTFGNVRIRRIIAASGDPIADDSWVQLEVEGLFDPNALARAVAWVANGEPEVVDGVLDCQIQTVRLRVSDTRATLWIGDVPEVQADKPFTIAETPDAEDTYWMWLADTSGLIPDLPMFATATGPATVSLQVKEGFRMKAQLNYETERAARLARNGLRNIFSLATLPLPRAAQDQIREFQRGFSVEAKGTVVNATILDDEFDLLQIMKDLMDEESGR